MSKVILRLTDNSEIVVEDAVGPAGYPEDPDGWVVVSGKSKEVAVRAGHVMAVIIEDPAE